MVCVLTPYQDIIYALKDIKWLDLMIPQTTFTAFKIIQYGKLIFNAYIFLCFFLVPFVLFFLFSNSFLIHTYEK